MATARSFGDPPQHREIPQPMYQHPLGRALSTPGPVSREIDRPLKGILRRARTPEPFIPVIPPRVPSQHPGLLPRRLSIPDYTSHPNVEPPRARYPSGNPFPPGQTLTPHPTDHGGLPHRPPILSARSFTPDQAPMHLESSNLHGRQVILPLAPTTNSLTEPLQRERAHPEIPRNLNDYELEETASQRRHAVFAAFDLAENNPHFRPVSKRMKRCVFTVDSSRPANTLRLFLNHRAAEPLNLVRHRDGTIESRRTRNGRYRADCLQFIELVDVVAGDTVCHKRLVAYPFLTYSRHPG